MYNKNIKFEDNEYLNNDSDKTNKKNPNKKDIFLALLKKISLFGFMIKIQEIKATTGIYIGLNNLFNISSLISLIIESSQEKS